MELAGLVWAGAMGWCMGHFVTTFIYRLPRRLPVAADKPYCDHCHGWLEVRDLFPVFSYLLNRGRCRFCGDKIPADYFWIELLAIVGFVTLYLLWGFGEIFLLHALTLTAVLALWGMWRLSRYLSPEVVVILCTLGLVLVALRDGSVMDAALWGAIFAFFGFARTQRQPSQRVSAEVATLAIGTLGVWVVYLVP